MKLSQELTVIIVIKVLVLLLIWYLFFSTPIAPVDISKVLLPSEQQTQQQ